MNYQLSDGPHWVSLPGGTFTAGSNDFYPEEAPRHDATVAPFELSATPITNRQFLVFVTETGYVTQAERALSNADFPHLTPDQLEPGSLVFAATTGPVRLDDWRQWWRWVPGASWRSPQGPASSLADKLDHPVVQVCYEDAQAYCSWAGGRLPTEMELEYAAAAGVAPSPYAWGDVRDPEGQLMANTWRGSFPYKNDGALGWVGTSPVASFPVNDFGLYDLIGNVWEWTSTEYTASHSDAIAADVKANGNAGAGQASASAQSCSCSCGPSSGSSPLVSNTGADRDEASVEPKVRVLKGGSHLCAPEYCLRYRPAARSAQSEDSSTSHIGFRIARSVA